MIMQMLSYPSVLTPIYPLELPPAPSGYSRYRLEIYESGTVAASGVGDSITEMYITADTADGGRFPTLAMTNYALPVPQVVSSYSESYASISRQSWKAFDKNTATLWQGVIADAGGGTRWIEINLGTGVLPYSYSLGTLSTTTQPRNFALFGENELGGWDGLDMRVNQVFSTGVANTYVIDWELRKKYFFFKFLSNNGGIQLSIADLRINTSISFPPNMTTASRPRPFSISSSDGSNCYTLVDSSIVSMMSFPLASTYPIIVTLYGGEVGYRRPDSFTMTAGITPDKMARDVELWWGYISDMAGTNNIPPARLLLSITATDWAADEQRTFTIPAI